MISSTTRSSRRRTAALTRTSVLGIAGLSLVVSGCAPSADGQDDATGEPTTVTVALDYIANNAGYAGLYAAESLGYYEEAGLDVQLNGYTSTSADVLVDSGQADFGTIDQGSLIIGRAVGEQLQAVAALMQHDAQRFVIAQSSAGTLTRPADLDGKTYGGWGLPIEEAINSTAIKNDGGSGEFDNVVLGTDAYNALESEQVDWAIVYETDDILWWEMDGKEFGSIDYRDYGVPDMYGKMLFSTPAYLEENPDIAEAFIDASLRGYAWAAENPEEAVDLMDELDVGPLELDKQKATATALAESYWLDADGVVGSMTAERWEEYAAFMTDAGVLTDSTGTVITEAPDTSDYFTLDFLSNQ